MHVFIVNTSLKYSIFDFWYTFWSDHLKKLPHWSQNIYVCVDSCTLTHMHSVFGLFAMALEKPHRCFESHDILRLLNGCLRFQILNTKTRKEKSMTKSGSKIEKSIRWNTDWAVIERLNKCVFFSLHKDLVDCVIYSMLFSSCCVPFRL